MTNFTPFTAVVGGLLIGLSASALLFFNGRIAGVSGVLGQAIEAREGGRPWRLAFIAGLAAGGVIAHVGFPAAFDAASGGSIARVAVAGLLVGYGTRLGNGCTSGHGVCGIGRRSVRSVVATVVFMAAAIATVFVDRHVLGGTP
jgi:uncharacterized protein